MTLAEEAKAQIEALGQKVSPELCMEFLQDSEAFSGRVPLMIADYPNGRFTFADGSTLWVHGSKMNAQ